MPTLLLLFALPAAENFRADSRRFENSQMDIVISEAERLPKTSVLESRIKAIGASLGSSFFIACSQRDLARQRGNFRHVVKIDEQPRRGQMLVGFLNAADDPTEQQDVRVAGQPLIDLEQFSPICNGMK